MVQGFIEMPNTSNWIEKFHLIIFFNSCITEKKDDQSYIRVNGSYGFPFSVGWFQLDCHLFVIIMVYASLCMCDCVWLHFLLVGSN